MGFYEAHKTKTMNNKQTPFVIYHDQLSSYPKLLEFELDFIFLPTLLKGKAYNYCDCALFYRGKSYHDIGKSSMVFQRLLTLGRCFLIACQCLFYSYRKPMPFLCEDKFMGIFVLYYMCKTYRK